LTGQCFVIGNKNIPPNRYASFLKKLKHMKRTITILIISMAGFITCFSQQYGWVDLSQNVPDSNYWNKNLRDIFFIGQEGWITGHFESELRVWHTTDGGNSFTTQVVPLNSGNGMSIFMRSLQEGYLVTNEGHVLRTQDGGNNWTTIGTGLGLLYSISFPPLPDTSGYICAGSGGKVCRVTGSNIAIEFTTPQTLTSIVFPVNSSEGWVCGGPDIRHRNFSGWHADQNYDNGKWYNAIFFTDNQHGWAVGVPQSGEGTIIYTANGTDWLGIPNLPDNNLNDVFLINNQEGWAVGNYIILHTTDGGLTWVKDQPLLADTAIFISVFAVNNHEVYVCGLTGNGELQKRILLKYTIIEGVKNQEETYFAIFPNPASNRCELQCEKCRNKRCEIELLDIYGRSVINVFSGMFPEEGVEIDLHSMRVGIYFVRFSYGSSVAVTKLVKQ
jgi:photosystem II stability/assembly factor-like uncharacterized protein